MSKEQKDLVARHLMEEGWKAREDLDFIRAEALLEEARSIFEDLGDWFNVTECLNHLSMVEKISAFYSSESALCLAEESMEVAMEHGTKKVLCLRAMLSSSASSGNYELALKYANEALELMDKPAAKADILIHIALFHLRTGNLKLAEDTLSEAKDLLDKGWDDEREPHRSIWKTSLLITTALVKYNQSKIEKAKEVLDEAMKIAMEKNLETRISQIDGYMRLFE